MKLEKFVPKNDLSAVNKVEVWGFTPTCFVRMADGQYELKYRQQAYLHAKESNMRFQTLKGENFYFENESDGIAFSFMISGYPTKMKGT